MLEENDSFRMGVHTKWFDLSAYQFKGGDLACQEGAAKIPTGGDDLCAYQLIRGGGRGGGGKKYQRGSSFGGAAKIPEGMIPVLISLS